jgi:hypothetical protein
MITCLVIFSLFFHPLHLSLTEVEMNDRAKRVEFVHKFFMDDLEAEVLREQHIALNITKSNEHPALEKHLKEYCKKHIRVQLNQQVAIPQFAGFRTDHEAIWVYQQLPYPSGEQPNVRLVVDALLDFYPDQKNMILINDSGKKESFMFTGSDSVAVF